jgi:hypothetical protein
MTSRPENSEPAANEAGGPTSLVPAASTALTIPPTRLAGSSDCLNCGTKLLGPFCYYCGQPDKNFLRFFPVLMRELLEDFLDFDSRFMRTMKPLLVQPGTLTRRQAISLHDAAAFVHLLQHRLLFPCSNAFRRCHQAPGQR